MPETPNIFHSAKYVCITAIYHGISLLGSGWLILAGGGGNFGKPFKNKLQTSITHAKKSNPNLKQVQNISPPPSWAHIWYTQIQLFFMKTVFYDIY